MFAFIVGGVRFNLTVEKGDPREVEGFNLNRWFEEIGRCGLFEVWSADSQRGKSDPSALFHFLQSSKYIRFSNLLYWRSGAQTKKYPSPKRRDKVYS